MTKISSNTNNTEMNNLENENKSTSKTSNKKSSHKMIGRYTVETRLGSGSFATVYKGVDHSQNPDMTGVKNDDGQQERNELIPKVVAIKAISRKGKKLTPKIIENLDLEINILKSYRHPNIVALHNVQKTERHFYLFLEFCGGGDLQQLIRTRKLKRLSERLTRRLMKDLTCGLLFLWNQNVIHRDIKPQNLLLTGPLPLDEIEDGDQCRLPEDEQKRRDANFPSNDFKLKIADFGFARPLGGASLAETLCGSPLYMAPEILEGQKYDAKADLWSVGTVLFEMIAGRPPFTGDNHIHLLRNIQTKSLRMPEGVKVSQECVHLLRLLLNRKPKQRASFQSFCEASNSFVSLGHEGHQTQNITQLNSRSYNNDMTTLGIRRDSHRMDTVIESSSQHESHSNEKQYNQNNLIKKKNAFTNNANIPQQQFGYNQETFASSIQSNHVPNQLSRFLHDRNTQPPPTPTPPLHLIPSLNHPNASTPGDFNEDRSKNTQTILQHYPYSKDRRQEHFIPLAPSPPGPSVLRKPDSPNGSLSPHFSLDANNIKTVNNYNFLPQNATTHPNIIPSLPIHHQNQPTMTGAEQQQQRQLQRRKPESSTTSESDSEFVIVDHGSLSSAYVSPNNSSTQISTNVDNTLSNRNENDNIRIRGPNSTNNIQSGWTTPSQSNDSTFPMSPRFQQYPQSRKMIGSTLRKSTHSPPFFSVGAGLLSTTPETGRALIATMMNQQIQPRNSNLNVNPHSYTDISSMQNFHRIKMIKNSQLITTSDMSIAAAMLATAEDIGRRAVHIAQIGDTRSFMAMRLLMVKDDKATESECSPMDEDNENMTAHVEDLRGTEEKNYFSDEMSTEDMNNFSKSQKYWNKSSENYNDDDEMPFAVINSDSGPPTISGGPKSLVENENVTEKGKPSVKSALSISKSHSHFREALSCYLKALSLMQGAVYAVQLLKDKIGSDPNQKHEMENAASLLTDRCNGSLKWLSGQFTGVLERADAANMETLKIRPTPESAVIPSVEELIYDHALAYGKDGAVKQLLGQYEASKTCYRSAGLLIEALLMEPSVGEDDQKVLNGYVDGFSERIKELGSLISSRIADSKRGGMNVESYSERMKSGSAVVGIVGSTAPKSNSKRIVKSSKPYSQFSLPLAHNHMH